MENIMSTAIVSERCCISCLQRKLNFPHYVYNMCVCGNILTCLWICVCIQAYFSVFMSWAEAHAAQDMRRNLSGASPCKHFCYYSTPALITLGLFRCALWPRLTAMASCETLSLPDVVIEETEGQQKPPAKSEAKLVFPALRCKGETGWDSTEENLQNLSCNVNVFYYRCCMWHYCKHIKWDLKV